MQAPQTLGQDQVTLIPPLHETQWCAAYVVARHEKVVADHMARKSVESFLPLYHSVRNWKSRRAQVELPLFPGYLFVRISAAERIRALEVPGVVHIVSFRGKPVAVPAEQIESLRMALQLRKSEPYPYLAAGRRVRIRVGPLQGVEGVVMRHNNQARIIVSVDFIQRSASVELWPEDLECLPDTSRGNEKQPSRD
jgi:transcription antitermination factor NusG